MPVEEGRECQGWKVYLLVAGCMVGIFSMCYSVLGCFGFGVFLLVRLKSLFLG